jgi:protein-disulfide isomerase
MHRGFAAAALALLVIGCNGMRGDGSPVAAEVDGERITEAQLDERIRDQLWKQQTEDGNPALVFELREAELQTWIEQRALDREAKKRGLDVDGLIAAELAARPVTDAEIAAFREQHKDQMPPIPDEQLLPQIRQHLQERREEEVKQEIAGRAQVAVHLTAPTVTVSSTGPSIGPADAPVTLIEFADFQCPYCVRAVPILASMRERYPTQLRVVFKHMPLDSIHPRARPAARAAVCAEKQDKFWPLHDLLFQNHRALDDAQIRTYAGGAGLDLAAFDACIASPETDARVTADFEEGRAAGITGTPAFVLNGRLLRGLRSPDDLAERIEKALAASGAPAPAAAAEPQG